MVRPVEELQEGKGEYITLKKDGTMIQIRRGLF
jgi:hypothetical protein